MMVRVFEMECILPLLCLLGNDSNDPTSSHLLYIFIYCPGRLSPLRPSAAVCHPEACDNPLGYKFSWSPRGVLLAGLNHALYKKDGQITQVQGDLFSHAAPIRINAAYNLECLPNRDSMMYAPLYGIDSAATMFRGTLRYQGFSRLMQRLENIGLFDLKSGANKLNGVTWGDMVGDMVRASDDVQLCKALDGEVDDEDANQAVQVGC